MFDSLKATNYSECFLSMAEKKKFYGCQLCCILYSSNVEKIILLIPEGGSDGFCRIMYLITFYKCLW